STMPLMIAEYPNRIPVENLKLLMAFGFFCAAAPTNTALNRRRGDQHNGQCGYAGLGCQDTLGNTLVVAAPFMAGACGSCGGCGGCGGGVYETFGAPNIGGWG
ncbi:unnamed protein product, partial [Meganyctiphanes norvegica]